jgi:hypothetical protein
MRRALKRPARESEFGAANAPCNALVRVVGGTTGGYDVTQSLTMNSD